MSLNIKNRIELLCRLIDYHNFKYYVENAPEISDLEYDALYNELEKLENEYPQYKFPHSPTQRVGAKPVSNLQKIQHPFPMLSISNTYEPSELKDFDRRCNELTKKQSLRYVVEPKIDGVAVTLMYENGFFVYAATRGDGYTGEDVSHTVKTIPSIPMSLPDARAGSRLEIRGEVYFENETFEKLNNKRGLEGLQLFANPRNAAAGTIKLLDPQLASERPLKAFLYSFGLIENFVIPQTQYKRLCLLKELKFPVNPHFKSYQNIQEVIDALSYWEKLMKTLPYNIDGIVIKVDDISLHEVLGVTLKSPRWAVAYKFSQESAFTRIQNITLQVGRTGAITPVAELEPVLLGGTTVSRATLHNPDEIRRKDIRIGDKVILEKGGGIIPKVLSVVKEARTGKEEPFKMPVSCPVCESPVSIDPDEVIPRCDNFNCPAQLRGRILLFCSRDAMNIQGIGPALLENLIENGLIRQLQDIYSLEAKTLEKLERMGEKSAENLIQQIERSKEVSLSRFIYSLGIRYVGKKSAQLLAQLFTSIQAVKEASVDDLTLIEEIGPTIAQSIVNFFRLPQNIQMIEDLQKYGVRTKQPESIINAGGEVNFFKGKAFVLTGTLKDITRSRATEIIEQYGGQVTGSISRNTDHLIMGDNPGSKVDKARKYGISILSEQEFKEKIHLVQGEC